MNEGTTWRYTFLGAIITILPVMIVLQLVRIQTNPKQLEDLLEANEPYLCTNRTFYPARGQIYDRWGHLLAGNQTVYQVGIELGDVRNPQTIALTLNVVLGMDYSTALGKASLPYEKGKSVYAVVEDYVAKEKVDRLKQLKEQITEIYGNNLDKDAPSLRGLVWHPHLERTYPEMETGSNILGFVSREGRGYFGVEEKYNDLLAGIPKTICVPNDPNKVTELPNIPDGASLILTIDRAVQAEMERIVDDSVAESGSKSGVIVVLDPKTGEILALAQTTRMDLNDFGRYGELYTNDNPFNRAVSVTYEPGSVYKVMTMASALDKGIVRPETPFLDTGIFEGGGAVIRNWNSGAWGPQTMQTCMQYSLNVCLASVAWMLGPRDFYSYMRSFGIGSLTGVDLAGEVPGRLKVPGDGDWYDADLATNSFGQGVSATPLQMASAISAVANDGKVMTPHIVKAMVNKGYQYDMGEHVSSIPLKADTAHMLTEMLAQTVEAESYQNANVDGYRMAGKTGTAEIPTPFGYTTSATNASFVGWGPTEDPRFLVYIWLEEPTSSPWGSEVAAPVFRDVVERLVVFFNIPPDDVRQALLSQ
jgi:cell division protein FtsI/penicillin-binding protein 2